MAVNLSIEARRDNHCGPGIEHTVTIEIVAAATKWRSKGLSKAVDWSLAEETINGLCQ